MKMKPETEISFPPVTSYQPKPSLAPPAQRRTWQKHQPWVVCLCPPPLGVMTDKPLIRPSLILPASPVIPVTSPDRHDIDGGFLLAHGLNGHMLGREVMAELTVATGGQGCLLTSLRIPSRKLVLEGRQGSQPRGPPPSFPFPLATPHILKVLQRPQIARGIKCSNT